MGKGIKTREIIKDIKLLDRAGTTGQQMKNAFIRTKEQAEKKGQSQEYSSPTEYAEDKITSTAGNAVHKSSAQMGKLGGKAIDKLKKKRKISKEAKQAKESGGAQVSTGSMGETAETKGTANQRARSVDQVKNRGQNSVQHSSSPPHQAADNRISPIRQAEKGSGKAATSLKNVRTAKNSIKSTSKATVKTVSKSVKTAEKTSKAAVKATQQTAKAAQRTAQVSVKAAQKAVQASRIAAKAAVTTIKTAVKGTIAAAKAAIAGTKALIAAIAAGGWVAVIAIIIICLIGMIVGSVFGIFFSNEAGEKNAMQAAISEINTDYLNELDRIKQENPHDILEMSGSKAVWKEVLAVYAVKTNTDPEDPLEVATITDIKKGLLKAIFWDMNQIEFHTSTTTETVTTVTDDGNGNLVESETQVSTTTLVITVHHMTAQEMPAFYGFSEEQTELLTELLDPEYDELWDMLLNGISKGDGNIVAVAASQIGNVGGEPYWSWYGFGSRTEWCACFVSWCADQCGYIESGVIPKFASCTSQGIPWFRVRGQWQGRDYIPSPGDIIFFDWEVDGISDHVGIVESVADGRVNTIEGNSGDACRRNSYPVGGRVITGYGTPMY